MKDIEERTRMLTYLKENEIHAVFHYVPLHSAPAGKSYGRFCGADKYTTKESERLIRLPMYYGLKIHDVEHISDTVKGFFEK